MNKPARINTQIRAAEVRVVAADGSQLGVLKIADALAQAEADGLDLVEVAPQAKPPVAKIIDWGKYQYEQTKLAQKARRNQQSHDTKEMRFGLKIGTHDRDIKLKKVRGFLEEGHKVKLTLRMKGREQAHPELGYEVLQSMVESLSDVAAVDQPAQLAGRQITTVVRKQ